MKTIKAIFLQKFEVILTKDSDEMYEIQYGHILGPLEAKSEKLTDYSMASNLFDMKVSEYETKLQ